MLVSTGVVWKSLCGFQFMCWWLLPLMGSLIWKYLCTVCFFFLLLYSYFSLLLWVSHPVVTIFLRRGLFWHSVSIICFHYVFRLLNITTFIPLTVKYSLFYSWRQTYSCFWCYDGVLVAQYLTVNANVLTPPWLGSFLSCWTEIS